MCEGQNFLGGYVEIVFITVFRAGHEVGCIGLHAIPVEQVVERWNMREVLIRDVGCLPHPQLIQDLDPDALQPVLPALSVLAAPAAVARAGVLLLLHRLRRSNEVLFLVIQQRVLLVVGGVQRTAPDNTREEEHVQQKQQYPGGDGHLRARRGKVEN